MQLADAQNALSQAKKRVEAQVSNLQQQAGDFHRQQTTLEQRLQEITYSSTSDEAVEAFASRMTKLRRLEIATNYLELVKEVERLRNNAIDLLPNDPREALSCYRNLRRLAYSLQETQAEAEGGAPQLMTIVEELTSAVYESLKTGLVQKFEATLVKMKWPSKEMNLLGGALDSWIEQAELLLELQEPDLLSTRAASKQDATASILPLEVMVQPLAQRFRYHFYGDKPTNRLDKPEYFLSHILDLLDRHSQFMMEELQPILDRRMEMNPALEDVYPDALSAFITTLLPLAVSKSLSLLHQITSQPQLLSHYIQESMSFDNSLRESWNYTPTPGDYSSFKGLTWSILDEHNYFDQWLKVEKDFALSRYGQIRDAADSGELDYDGVEPGQSAPMKDTIRVNDLLETITERYRGLPLFKHKMKFLMDIQLEIFDKYHAHLYEVFQAYLAMSHTAGRLLQGQLSKHEAFDQRALASLCKIYGSAEYLERKMADWSDDVFFVDLWAELQQKSHSRGLSNEMQLDEIAAKTSQSIMEAGFDTEDGTGSLFDETAAAYRRVKEQSAGEMFRLIDVNIREAVNPYGKLDAWASLSEAPSDLTLLSPSSALDGILQVTTVLLKFMSRALGRAALRRMAKHFCSSLQSDIISAVVLAHNFSAAGVAQFKRDILAVMRAIEVNSGLGDIASSGLRKLEQAVTLLGLPIKRSSNRMGTNTVDDADDGWGFDEDSGEPAGSALEFEATKDDVWGLWEAEKEIFKSNEAARQALSDMGLDYLSEQEARNILKRRVELGS